jgi:homoserine O-succinyltransferase
MMGSFGTQLELVTDRQSPAGPAPAAITVAIVNNMPDAAFRATERQFCRLIEAASQGMTVNLKFFALPQAARSAAVSAHIDQYYEDYESLEDAAPDGLIVTGAKPAAARLRDDPFCEPIARLVEWAVDCAVPGIWSCMAAHVAVLHLDGIERQPLARKISGLYECRLRNRAYQIQHGLPATWTVPHSRINGLAENQLISRGYAILSKSSEAGIDVFSRKQGALQLFFQGHPEYDGDTLLREYRRDAKAFLLGETDDLPAAPAHCFDRTSVAQLTMLSQLARQTRNLSLLDNLDTLIQAQPAENSWFPVARRIYTNWLAYIACRGQGSQLAPAFSHERSLAHFAA